MRKTTFLFAFVIWFYTSIISYAQAPDWQWAKSAGGVDSDVAQAVAADKSGNVYVAGRFHSPTLTMGTITLTNKDNTGNSDDLFIAKYDASGHVLWAKSAGENHSNDVAMSLAVDVNGLIYMTGFFESPTITFDTTTLVNVGAYDFFLAQLDTGGNVLWAKSAGGSDIDQGTSVAVDALGNTYVSGWYYNSSITFGSVILPNTGSADVFLAKYSAIGNVLWAKSFGGVSFELTHSLAADTMGNIYMAGEFGSPTVTIDTVTLTKTGTDSSDAFIVKVNANGHALWAKSVGGMGNVVAYAVGTNKSHHIYIAGKFSSNTLSIGTDVLTNAGGDDLFLAKYDTDGHALWAIHAGGSGDDVASSVAIDVSGNACITGLLQSSNATFGNTTLTHMGIYLAKYSHTGNLLWVKSPGLSNYDRALSVATDTSENIYLTGSFNSSSIPFDNCVLTNTGGSADIFLAKADCIAVTGIYKFTTPANILIYPNPTPNFLTIENPNTTTKTYTLSLTNVQGQLLFSEQVEINKTHTLDLSTYPNGIYFLNLQNEKENYVSKVVVQR